MGKNLTHQLIESHLVEGRMEPGEEIGAPDRPDPDPGRHRDHGHARVRGDAGPTGQDGALGPVRRPQPAAGRLQERRRPPLPARAPAGGSACWYSRPGNGVSHPVHMERFGIPGQDPARRPTATPPPPARSGMLAHGRGRARGRARHGGRALLYPHAAGDRACGWRAAAGLGQRQGRHPRDAAPARRQGRRSGTSSSITDPGSNTSRRWTGT